MAVDLAELKTEIDTDPLSIGYAAMGDREVAEAMNDPSRERPVDRTIVPSREIIGATTPADWGALSAAERQRYQTITGAGEVDVSQQNVRSAFGAMFPQGSDTRAALLDLVTRPGSRAEELFGAKVTPSDVADARRL